MDFLWRPSKYAPPLNCELEGIASSVSIHQLPTLHSTPLQLTPCTQTCKTPPCKTPKDVRGQPQIDGPHRRFGGWVCRSGPHNISLGGNTLRQCFMSSRLLDDTHYMGTSLIINIPPQDPTVALCLGTYGSPRGVGVSYERGTPVCFASEGLGLVERRGGPDSKNGGSSLIRNTRSPRNTTGP